MPLLRTILFYAFWIIGTVAMGAFGLLLMPLPRRFIWRFNAWWARYTVWCLRVTCGVRSTVEGVVQGPVIASKHQSTLDTMVLWYTLKNPVFVLKRELYLVPIFGWFLWRSGQIAINRSKGRTAFEQILAQAPALIAQGRTLVVFPEGTRVRVGDHKPMRTGIARISAALQLPVTPIGLNCGLFWPKHSLLKKPGHARLHFMEPVPACGEDSAVWMQELETRINTRSQQLVDEAKR